MKQLIVIPLFFFLFFSAFSISVFAVSVNFSTDIEDCQVWQWTPTTNYGSNYLDISSFKSGSNPSNRDVYILFNVSEIPANSTIINASLITTVVAMPTTPNFNILVYNTTTSNWSENSTTWNSHPAEDVLILNTTIAASYPIGSEFYPLDIKSALQTAVNTGKNLSLKIRPNLYNNTSGQYIVIRSKEYITQVPFLSVDFLSPDNCTTSIIGSYCDIHDPFHRGIITTPDYSCQNDTYTLCPEGDLCSQLTPVANTTTPLSESVSLCSVCWFAHTLTGAGSGSAPTCPASKGFSSGCLWTNCPNNPECECLGVFCNSKITIVNITSIPVSVNDYTVGCFNPITGGYDNVTLANGTVTSITNFSNSVFPNGTSANQSHAYQNSSTTCYDNNGNIVVCYIPNAPYCNSYADSLALAVGGMFGVTNCGLAQNMSSIIITLIVGIIVTILLAYYGGISDGIPTIFGLVTMLMLVLFTLIGWFPAWLIVIMIVTSALAISGLLGKLVGGGG